MSNGRDALNVSIQEFDDAISETRDAQPDVVCNAWPIVKRNQVLMLRYMRQQMTREQGEEVLVAEEWRATGFRLRERALWALIVFALLLLGRAWPSIGGLIGRVFGG